MSRTRVQFSSCSVNRPLLCRCQPLEIGDDYCGEHDINHPIRGSDAVSATAAVTWSGDDVTSVAVATTGNHTVAFVGTASGRVKKVSISAIFSPVSCHMAADNFCMLYSSFIFCCLGEIKLYIQLTRRTTFVYFRTKIQIVKR